MQVDPRSKDLVAYITVFYLEEHLQCVYMDDGGHRESRRQRMDYYKGGQSPVRKQYLFYQKI